MRMIERHYGALLDGAGPESVAALGSLEAELEAKTRAAADAGGSRERLVRERGGYLLAFLSVSLMN